MPGLRSAGAAAMEHWGLITYYYVDDLPMHQIVKLYIRTEEELTCARRIFGDDHPDIRYVTARLEWLKKVATPVTRAWLLKTLTIWRIVIYCSLPYNMSSTAHWISHSCHSFCLFIHEKQRYSSSFENVLRISTLSYASKKTRVQRPNSRVCVEITRLL